MGAKVTFKIVSEDKFNPDKSYNKPAFVDGQLIFVPGDNGFGKIYLDYNNERTCYTPEGGSVSNGLNYVGISTTDPASGIVTIDGDEYSPHEKDVVVYGKKEYLYRKDKNGDEGWFEIGDEEAPAWDDD
jgi:hypothetical protein